MRRLLPLLCLLAGACGEVESSLSNGAPRPVPFTADYEVSCGIQVHVDATRGIIPSWVGTESADRYICKVAAWVEQVAEVEPGATRGVLLVWTGELLPSTATATGLAAGVYHGLQNRWAARWTEVSTWDVGWWNKEDQQFHDFVPQGPTQTSLAHELLHALIWNPEHTDPRWPLVDIGQVEHYVTENEPPPRKTLSVGASCPYAP